MEIVQERLEREYDLDLITTTPTVVYEVETTDGRVMRIDNPAKLPDPARLKEIREPIIRADILVPQEYIGNVITLCIEKRGVQKRMQYLGKQMSLEFELPLNEVVLDFFDRLKSVSRGYASFDYTYLRHQPAQMFEVAIQAAIGSKILARTTVKALRKNVTAKCYGGDITRKRKLLEKQKEGKKRMKQFGSIEIPQKAFMAILHVGKEE